MLANELKTGTIFKEDNSPYLVMKYEHIKSARGGANVKVKARNLLTGQVLEKSYLASAKVDDADVMRKNAQYLYKEKDYVFMDPDTYEQIYIAEDIIGEPARFLIEGINVQVLYFEDRPVSVDLPITMVFEITYTEPGFRGNTVSTVFKDATLANGAIVKVPTFAKIGDKIKVDTRSGEYVSTA
ncbi:elongation factor P [candidate division WWE3 bacterium]|uniref:Elongation factor P n=1 Tax=candidate division WWE3 bacterium TaxID=2053526 RepID=A0A7X9DKE7_UNCKA|nr:elongation factor P [candidate division WWE3 bacterium]